MKRRNLRYKQVNISKVRSNNLNQRDSKQSNTQDLESYSKIERETYLCPFCHRSFHRTKSLMSHMIDSYTITKRYIHELSKTRRRTSKPKEISIPKHSPLSSESLIHYQTEFHNLIAQIQSEAVDDSVLCFKSQLEDGLDSILPGSELFIYGSFDTGIKLASSDLDLTLSVDFVPNAFMTAEIYEACIETLGENDTHQIATEIIFSKMIDCLKSLGITQIHSRVYARIPILRFIAEADRPFQIDLCLNKFLPLHNSSLIRTYCKIDSRVSDLGLLLKYFVKQRNISDATSGTLTSYTHLLLLIHFLQKRPQPILPNLQLSGETNIVEGYDCRFDREYEKYIHTAQLNTECVTELFYEFAKFWSEFEWVGYGIRLKECDCVERGKDDSYPLIYDPFETERSLGKVCSKPGFERIQFEFKRACKMLREGKNLSLIMEYL